MKKKIALFLLLIISSFFIFNFLNNRTENKLPEVVKNDVKKQREKHPHYLENSPSKEISKRTKEGQKAKMVPPNKLTEVNNKSREKHAEFLEKSPFKERLRLSKTDRSAMQLPGKRFYEELFQITVNPNTGVPEPNKVLELQKKLIKTKNISQKVPGDAIDNKWIERGPNNVGGRTRTLLFDPNDPTKKRVFAGAVSGGLWVNKDITNNESPWILVEDVPGNLNISCIATDPRNPNIWYLGTGEQYNWNSPSGNGIYKSLDGGISWENMVIIENQNSTDGIYYINDIIIRDAGDNSEIYLGVGAYGPNAGGTNGKIIVPSGQGSKHAGLYKSTDDGNSWKRIESENFKWNSQNQDYYFIPNDFEIAADNKIWMSTIGPNGWWSSDNGGGRIFSSVDGDNWDEAPISPIGENENRIEISVSSTNPNKLYALTQTADIYVTEDSFNTIEVLAKPNDIDQGIPANDFTRGQGWYNLVIEVDPKNDDILYVGGICLFKSIKGANTLEVSDWKQISQWYQFNEPGQNYSVVHADQHELVFRPGNSNEAIIGNDGGIYYAYDLENSFENDVIQSRNKNYNVTQFYYGAYGENLLNEQILGGTQDNGTQFFDTSSSQISSSFDITSGDGGYCEIDKDGDYVISSRQYGVYTYFRTPVKAISNETYYDSKLLDRYQFGKCEGAFINPADLDHSLDILYTCRDNKISRYTLGDKSAIEYEINLNILNNENITSIKVSPYSTNSSMLIVGTINGKLFSLKNGNLAEDQIIWDDITGKEFVGSVSDIQFGETEDDIIVTFSNYGIQSVWYTSNKGISWHTKNGDLPDLPVFCVVQNPLAKNEVIVGTMLGVWSTNNFDEEFPNWERAYNGMRDVMVLGLDIRKSDNSVLASTYGRGLFTGKFSASTANTFSMIPKERIVQVCQKTNQVIINFDYKTNGDYHESTNLSILNLPDGVESEFSVNSIKDDGLFSLALTNLNEMNEGEYVITVIASGAKEIKTDIVLRKKEIIENSNLELLLPENISKGVSIMEHITYSWREVSGALSYKVEISSDPSFNNVLESSGEINSNSYRSNNFLELNKIYYWRVSASSNCFSKIYSEVRKFQTEPLKECVNYNSTDFGYFNIAIPDNIENSIWIPIEVNEDFKISDVNVTVDITHENIKDLKISIASPEHPDPNSPDYYSPYSIVLFNGDCNDNNNLVTTFDDQTSVIYDCTNSNELYLQPHERLSNQNGFNSKGMWQFSIRDYEKLNTGYLNNFILELCYDQPVLNSILLNNKVNVGSNTSYYFKQSEIEAESEGTDASEQLYMITKLPSKGELFLNSILLKIGQTFTQEDINIGNFVYKNVIDKDDVDTFEVDITNATNGFLPNQIIFIHIDTSIIGDDDNDGVMNDKDQCPDTSIGTNVDNNGCFTLPSNNFTIEVISESCPDRNNGQILIKANEAQNYVVTIAGTEYNFIDNLTVDGLMPSSYEFCITVTGEDYKQCYTITIAEGTMVSGKASLSSNKVTIDIEQGTAPFNVFINNEIVFQTNSSSFSVDVKHGDLVQVKTNVTCEGVFAKTISLFEDVIVYPNPSSGIFEIDLPLSQKEVIIELYNTYSQLISKTSYTVQYGKVQLDLSSKPVGVYVAKILLDNPVNIKIVKK